MAYKLTTNSNYSNVTVYPVGSGVRVRRLVANGSGPDMSAAGVLATFSAPTPFGRATGRQLQPVKPTDAAGKPVDGWMEVTTPANVTGWVRFDLLTRSTPTAAVKEGDGETLLKSFLNRDLRTGTTLAYAQRLIAKGDGKKNAKVLATAGAKADALATRLKARQAKVQGAKAVVQVTKFVNPVLGLFGEAALDAAGVKGLASVGAIPVVAVVAGVALVAGISWYAAYSYFKTDAEASEIDLNEARALAKLLEQADPITKAKVMAEVKQYGKAQLDKGYEAAKTEESPLGQTGGMLKVVGFGLLAAKLAHII